MSDGDKVLLTICTPQGFKVVALDASDGGGSTTPATAPVKRSDGKAEGQCPLCPLVAGLAFAPASPILPPVEPRRHTAVALPGSRIATGWFLATLQARGPPSLT